MLKKRIIPVLLLKDGRMVKGKKFKDYIDTGNPISQVKIYTSQYTDELMFIDIQATINSRKTLLNITKRVFTLETEAIELLTAASGFQIGHLSIGAISPHQITNIVMNFGKAYPDVDLSVSLGNSQEIIDRVLDFRDDVGIVPQIEKDPRFLSIAYSRNRVVLLVPKKHEWGKKKTVKIGMATRNEIKKELTNHIFIFLTNMNNYYQLK